VSKDIKQVFTINMNSASKGCPTHTAPDSGCAAEGIRREPAMSSYGEGVLPSRRRVSIIVGRAYSKMGKNAKIST